MTLVKWQIEHLSERVIHVVELAMREVWADRDDSDPRRLGVPYVDKTELVWKVDLAKVVPPPLALRIVRRVAQPSSKARVFEHPQDQVDVPSDVRAVTVKSGRFLNMKREQQQKLA